MKKGIKYVVGVLLITLSMMMFLTMTQNKIKAQPNESVGTIEVVPNWVKGHEATVKQKFVDAYIEAGFTVEPEGLVQSVDLGKARVVLFQDYGSDGTIFLNEREGRGLVVTDVEAIAELKNLLGLGTTPITDQNKQGVLQDIVISNGKTYYVTDAYEDFGTFSIEDGNPIYLTEKIGVGAHYYWDITWIEFSKAYKLSAQFMTSLGLPSGVVTKKAYTTRNLLDNGKYDGTTTSEKTYIMQQFEHGYIMQAPMQILNAENNLVMRNTQYPAAPILNEMYQKVTALSGNSNFNKTGMPVSIEYVVDGVKYQNFEFGYVKVENNIAEFIIDLVVDSQGTPMNRRVGLGKSWDNLRGTSDNPNNHGEYLITWERLRVYQNFRELVGQIIRDARAPLFNDIESSVLRDIAGNAPNGGLWISFSRGEGFDLGGGKMFLYHTYWYSKAYELAPIFNVPSLVDNNVVEPGDIGRPSSEFVRFYNVQYQYFDNGFAYRDIKYNFNAAPFPTIIVGEAAMAEWLGEYPDVESALIGKGIVIVPDNPNNEIGTFKKGIEPAWTKPYLTHIQESFQQAYNNAGFQSLPAFHVYGKELEKAHVMIYQQFGDEGYIVMNDILGKAYVLTVEEFNSISYAEVFLSTLMIDDYKYIVTDKRLFRLESGKRIEYPYKIGVGSQWDYWDVTPNDFTKAYKMAENYHPEGLGKPLGETKRKIYNTYDLENNGMYKEDYQRSEKHYTLQQFEKGYIISARMRKEGTAFDNYAVQHGAAPITNEMYNKVIAIPNNSALSETGAPVSIQFIHNGIKYQNFEYGYVKLNTNGVIEFIRDLVVDSKGTEMNRRIGAGESFNNWLNKPKEYELAWERLRVGQNFREAMGEMIRAGRRPYNVSTEDPYGDLNIYHVPHEFDGLGVVHIYKNGEGTGGHVFGNSLIIQGHWYNKAYELAPLLNELGAGYTSVGSGDDEVRTYHRDLLGRPSGQWQTISNLTFQTFEKGVAYKDGINDIVMSYGSAFDTWMGTHETIMDAIIAKKLIKWEVVFYNADNTVLKTVQIAHYDDASSEAPPVTPPTGQKFLRWDKDIESVTSNLEVRPVFEPTRHTVWFKDYDNRIIATIENVLYGGSVTAPASPERLGYNFTSWDRTLTNITSDVSIHAQYEIIHYTITYQPTELEHSNPTTYTVESADITLMAPTAPSGYTFYRYENTDGQAITVIEKGSTGNLTLIAKFNPIEYEITYQHLLAGDINTNNSTTFKITDLPLTLSDLFITRAGHTFIGWFSDSEHTTQITEITEIGNIDVYAKITPNPHTITYKVIGEEDVVEHYLYGEAITLRDPLTKVGYQFTWDKTLPETMPDEDIIINGVFSPINYTITYLPVGIYHTNPTTYTIEDTITLTGATKMGYTFIGWRETSLEGVELTEISVGSTGDITLYANLSPENYAINYHLNGGQNHIDNPSTYTIEDDTIMFKAPEKVGYTFVGWFEEETFENIINEVEPIDWLVDVEVYAKWQVNQYTITFDSDGGTEVAAITQDYNTSITAPEAPTKVGYTFMGWSPALPAVMPDANLTVTATWQINEYTITFDSLGGSVLEPITLPYNSDLTLPTPTKDGETFKAWYRDITLQNQFTKTKMPAENMTLYAAYTEWPIITLLLDGGNYYLTTLSQQPTTEITLEGTPTKVGYTFIGWSPELPAVMPDTDLTVTAMWQINKYTITFDSDGGTEVAAITQDYNEAIIAPEDPTKVGYTFMGWSPALPAVMPDANLTVTATWQINEYTIAFDSDGGTEVVAITQDYNTIITPPENPTKVGYTFIGWEGLPTHMPAENVLIKALWQINSYTLTIKVAGLEDVILTYTYNEIIEPIEDPVKVGYTFNSWDLALPELMPANDLVINASFDLITYTITYHANEGSHENNILTYTVESDPIILLDATKVGYQFTGWYPLPDAGDKIEAIKTGSVGDIDLYAQYDILSYTITYYIDEVIDGEVESYVYNSPITHRPLPEKQGHTFSGWDMIIPELMPANHLVINGSFTINVFEVVFKDGDQQIGDIHEVAYGGHVTPPTPPTKVGYTFLNWDQETTNITSDLTINAIYTINTYRVTFLDSEGALIGAVQTVNYLESATPPTAPVVVGKVFDQWDQDYTNVKSDLIITALYVNQVYQVKFVDHLGELIKEVTVEHGENATPPTAPIREGFTFDKWDRSSDNITRNITIKAIYKAMIHEVKFLDKDGNQIGETQHISHIQAAIAPDAPVFAGYRFDQWDKDFSNITGPTTIRAIYIQLGYEVRFLDKDGNIIGEVQTVLYGEDATPPTAPEIDDYTFKAWSHSYKDIRQNLDIKATYELNFTEADVMMRLREAKQLINAVNELEGLLINLPANELYMMKETLDEIKLEVARIETALMTASTDEEILSLSKALDAVNKKYSESVLPGEKVDEPQIPDPKDPEDPQDPEDPKTPQVNVPLIMIAVVFGMLIIGVIIRIVFIFKK